MAHPPTVQQAYDCPESAGNRESRWEATLGGSIPIAEAYPVFSLCLSNATQHLFSRRVSAACFWIGGSESHQLPLRVVLYSAVRLWPAGIGHTLAANMCPDHGWGFQKFYEKVCI